VSVTLTNLARLSHYDTSRFLFYTTRIERTFGAVSALLERAPRALASSVAALMRHQVGYRQFIVLGSPESSTVQAYLDVIRRATYIPNRVLIYIDPNSLPKMLAERNEVVKAIVEDVERSQASGKLVGENVRLCEGFTCRLPVVGLDEVRKLVEGA